MGRRGDHIRKRKDGRWEGRYCIERRKDGKIRYGSVYGRTHKEVKDKLASITPGDVSAGSKGLTFEHLAKLWLDSNRIRLKGSTITLLLFMIWKETRSYGCTRIMDLRYLRSSAGY